MTPREGEEKESRQVRMRDYLRAWSMPSGWAGVGVLVCLVSMAAPGSAQTNADGAD